MAGLPRQVGIPQQRTARIDLREPSPQQVEDAVAQVCDFCAADPDDVTVTVTQAGFGVLSIVGRHDPEAS